jgi:3-oxoacid CoA-transferase subunit B
VLREVAPGVTTDDVVAATEAPLTVPDDVPTMALPATL